MTHYTGSEELEILQQAKNYNEFLVKEIIHHCHSNKTILDFGAGIRTFSDMLSKRADVVVHCVEIDDEQARLIETRGLQVFRSSSEVSDHQYDLIYTLNVLEHIECDVDVLKELEKN